MDLVSSDVVAMQWMIEADAMDLLGRSLVRKENLDSSRSARELLDELDRHPLAATQKAGYLHVNTLSSSEDLELLQRTNDDKV